MKKMNKKGFTLAELLIVVAIIAVLVAVAIPVFTAQLEKSRQATDLANIRSSYAEAMSNYLVSNDGKGDGSAYKMQNTNTGNGLDKADLSAVDAKLKSAIDSTSLTKGSTYRVHVENNATASDFNVTIVAGAAS